jgi:hypothetical protein
MPPSSYACRRFKESRGLSQTGLDGIPLAEASDLEPAFEWITCKVLGQKLEARCRANVLMRMINIFP